MPAGSELLSLDPEAVTGQSFGTVTSLALSPSDGSLWIGTEDEGILRIGRNGKRICYTTQSNHLLSNRISQLCFVPSGLLYILYDDGRISAYSSTLGYSHREIISGAITQILAESTEGSLIGASADGKVYRIPETGESVLLGDIREPVAAITCGDDGRLYIAGRDSKAVKSLGGTGVGETVTSSLPEAPTCMIALKGGDLWVGTGQGLYRWREGAWTRYSTENGLVSNRVKSLVWDGREAVLMATPNGIGSMNVSNPDVSKSNVYFVGEPFSCGLNAGADSAVIYFGGAQGLAVVSSDSIPMELPWNVQEDAPKAKDKRGFSFWRFLLFLAFGIAGFGAGYLLSAKRVAGTASSTPSTVQQAIHHTDAPADKTVRRPQNTDENSLDPSAVVPPSREEIFEVIDKLKAGEAPEFSLRVWNMIEDSYTDQAFSVQNIASRLLLSRVHVNRKLQQETGISPSALLKARRMTAARDLMLQGGMTLPQLVQRTGFSSAAFLSTSFKEYYGQSPSELMRQS